MTDSIEAYVQISVLSGMEEDVLPEVLKIEGVKKLSTLLTGSSREGSIIAEVYGKDMQNYTDIVREIRMIKGVRDTSASILVPYVKE